MKEMKKTNKRWKDRSVINDVENDMSKNEYYEGEEKRGGMKKKGKKRMELKGFG